MENRFIHPKTGKEMILIPPGEFVMGEDDKAHKVYLDSFYIARYPMTNAEYKKFVNETKRNLLFLWKVANTPKGRENNPVENVKWNEAVAYAR